MTVMTIFVSDTWRTKTNSKTATARLEESRMLWSCKTQIVYLLPEPWSSEKDEKLFEGKEMKYEKTSKVPVICANFLTPNQSRTIRLRKFDPIQVGEEPQFLREKQKTKK